MQKICAIFFILYMALSANIGGAADPQAAQRNSWLILDIGTIGAASADMLASALKQTEEAGFEGLIIQLDTPGGTLDATRTMVKAMLATDKPIIVWVGPAGSRAGSAGAFITLAAHVAAMAPGSNIGAAHPVQADGQDIASSDAKDKITNDTLAFMESIATARGRNKDMALSFVENSVSITAQQALENKVIDLIAASPESVLDKIDGQTFKLKSGPQVMATADDRIVVYQKSLRENFLEVISNPNVFYLLFIAGMIGLGIELTNPGVLVPGVVGAICIIIALISTSVLPISFGAIILIAISAAFIVAEVFVPSFGILGIGGFVGFVIGSLLLVDSSNELGLEISIWTIAPTAVVVGGFSLTAAYFIFKTDRSKVTSGVNNWAGKEAEVLADFIGGTGKVRIDGEIWEARAIGGSSPLMGERVLVQNIDGLVLEVIKN